MHDPDFLNLMQRYVANIAISGSTLRNQGAKSVVKKARTFLAELDLTVLKGINPPEYTKHLDIWTSELMQQLPKNAKHWGTARKALNVFMIQVFLNKYLSKEYGLQPLANVLETPLDSQAAKALRRLVGRGKLPRWTSIKSLTPESSDKYQEFASEFAVRENIPRACLDILLWRANEPE